MAHWMINCSNQYLSLLYDYLHEKIYEYHVLQADETPVLVTKDGRDPGEVMHAVLDMLPDRAKLTVGEDVVRIPEDPERKPPEGIPERIPRDLHHGWIPGLPHTGSGT